MHLNELKKIMFLDIETVPQVANFSDLPDELAHLWEEKFHHLRKHLPEKYNEKTTASEAFNTSAGIYSEFGKIICIAVGFIHFKEEEMFLRTKYFINEEEKELLREFSQLIEKFGSSKENRLCGHNIKEFDVPYICRRMLINNLPLPSIFQLSGKKPWESSLIDTMELWKFGDYKNFTSLKLLTAVFNIPTPKDDIDGSEVAQVYYKEKNIQRIAQYCTKDVIATAQVFLRLNGFPPISAENIENL